MSTTIDERVVEMRFDNQQFEKNVQTSMGTLEKLKKSLNLKGASKGLDEFGSSADTMKVSMSNLVGSIGSVQTKLSALNVFKFTFFKRLADDAITSAKRIANEFTLAPVNAGFSEFEQKMGSVQTIMASTGESLETVNQYLNELNTYSDKTIYSFSDMTSNIGKFTNAGVKLEDAVMAIKGISNEAALSGANANEASRAMYNFAQALSAGYVKLIDWKSIENANMATVSFKEQLLEAAVAAGTVEKTTDGMYRVLTENAKGDTMDDAISATSNFNDSLSYQWMTTEVLVNTLKDYADETTDIGKKAYAAAQDVKTFSMMMDTLKEAAQSGWAQTWELIIGDFEEGKALWTELSEFFGQFIDASADARNEFLGGALNSNWEKLVDEVSKAGNSVDAFQDKIKAVAAEHGIEIDKMIEEQGSLAAVMESGAVSSDIVMEAINALSGAVSDSSQAVGEASEGFGNLAEIVTKYVRGDFGTGQAAIEAITEAGYDFNQVQELTNKTYEAMGHSWGTWEEVLEAAGETIGENTEVISELSDEELKNIEYTDEQIASMRALAENLAQPSGRALLFESIMDVLKSLVAIIRSVKEAWKGVFGDADSGKLYEMIQGFNNLTGILHTGVLVHAQEITRVFQGVFSVFDAIASLVGGALSEGFEFLKGIFEDLDIDIFGIAASVGDALTAWSGWAKSNNILTNSLKLVWNGLKTGISTISSWISQFKNLPEVSKWLEGVRTRFDEFATFLRTQFPNAAKFVDDFVSGIKKMAGIGDDWDGTISISTFVDNFVAYISDVEARVEDLKKFFGDVKNTITSFFDEIANRIKQFFGGETEGAGEGLANALNIEGIGTPTFLDGFLSYITDFKARIAEFKEFLWNTGNSILSFFEKFFTKTETKDFSVMDGAAAQEEGFGTIVSGDKLGKAGKILSSFAETAKNFIKEKFGISIPDSLKQIGDAIGSFVDQVKTLLGGFDFDKLFSSAFSVAILVGLGKVVKGMGGLSKSIVGIIDGIDNVVKDVPNVFKSVSGVFDGITKVIKDSSKQIQKVIKNFAKIEKAFSKVLKAEAFKTNTEGIKNLGEALLMLVGAVAVLTLLDADKMWESIAAVGVLSAILVALAYATKSISESSASIGKDGISVQRTTSGLVQIAAAVLMMLAVVKLTGGLSLGEVAKGTAFVIAFTVFAKLVTKATTIDGGKTSASSGLVGITIAIGLMVGVVKLASKLKVGEMVKGGIFVAAFLIFVKQLVKITTLDSGQSIAKVSGMILSLSIAIGLLAGVAGLLGFIPIENLAKGIVAIGALGLIMTAMIAATKGANSVKGNLLVMTGVILVLAGILAALAAIPDPTSLAAPALALSALMGMFAILAKATDNVKVSLGSMAIMTAVVAALALILAGISMLNPGPTLEIAASISLVMLAMSAALRIISGIEGVSTSALITIGVLTLVAGAIGAMLALITKLNPGPTLEIATSLSLVLIALSTAALILSQIGPAAAAGVGSAAAFLALVTAAGVILGAIGGLISLIPGAQEFLDSGIPIMESIGKNLGALVGGIFAGIGEAVTGALPNMASDITLAMSQLSVASSLAQMIEPGSFDGVADLVDVLGSIALNSVGTSISDVFTSLFSDSETSMDKFKEDGVAFFNAMKDITDAATGITIEESSFDAIVAAGEKLSELQSSIEPIGGFAKAITGRDDLKTFGQNAADFLGEMKTALATENYEGFTFDATSFGAITEAATELTALQSTIEPIGGLNQALLTGKSDLASFGENAADFLDEMKTALATENFEGFTYAEGTIGEIITAATELTTLQSSIEPIGGLNQTLLTGKSDLASFGENVSDFLGQMKTALDSGNFEGFTYAEGSLSAIISAATDLSALESTLTPMGGVIDWFTKGTVDLGDFGTKASAFLTEMSTAVSTIGDNEVNADALDSMITAAGKLSELQSTLDGENDIIAWFKGKDDLSDFSTKVGDFATAMGTLKTNLGDGFSDDSITSMTNAGAAITALADSLPSDDNFFEKIIGGKMDLSTFAGYIEQLGTALGTFGTSIETINGDKSKAAVKAAKGLKDVMIAVKDINGKGLDKFTEESGYIEDVANVLVRFDEIIADIDISKTSTAVQAAKDIKDFITTLSGFDTSGISEFESSLQSVDFASAVDTLISGFVTELNDQKDKVSEAIMGMIPSGDNVGGGSGTEAGAKLAEALISGFTEKISGASEDASAAAVTLVAACLAILVAAETDARTSGTAFANNFGDGINDGLANVTTKAALVAIMAAQSTRAYYQSFYSAGAYLVSGFALGISDRTWAAEAKARAMASAASRAAKSELDENSPSKVFYEIGNFAGLGFVNALSDSVKSAKEAGSKLAGSARDGLSKSVSKISSFIEDGIDATPTIRPVLDLSNVQANAKRIGGMLNAKRSIALAENLSASTISYGNLQNGINDEVVSAIGKLQNALGSQGGDTYNVNGITYDDGSNIADAVRTLIRTAKVGRRA